MRHWLNRNDTGSSSGQVELHDNHYADASHHFLLGPYGFGTIPGLLDMMITPVSVAGELAVPCSGEIRVVGILK